MKKVIKGILWFLFIMVLLFAAYVVYYNSTKDNRKIEYKEMIQKELKETGKLIVLEGKTHYFATKEEPLNLFGTPIEIGKKTLELDLQFNYGFSVDLSEIEVEEDVHITLFVDGDSIVLDYIYLDPDNSFIKSSSSLLVKSYTQEEIQEIQKACIQEVKNELYSSQENIIRAKASLEKQLKAIVAKIANREAVIIYR